MSALEKIIESSLRKNWDAEVPLYRFECLIDTIEKISDGLPEDRTTQNALNGVHEGLCDLHADFKKRLLLGM